MRNADGFTLIETIIYIALLSLVMGGVLAAAYGLVEGSQRVSRRTIIQEEGNFVLRKINWVIGNTASIIMPSAMIPADTLMSVLHDGSQITIRFDAGNSAVEVRRGGGSFVPLTSQNVLVSNLQFVYLPHTPPGIAASTTINGFVFETTKYLRK